MNTVLLLIAIIPVILLATYVYKKDKNKEPGCLLIKFFLLGIASTILVVAITIILEQYIPLLSKNTENMNYLELFIYVFIFIALIEELCKWLITYKIGYNNKEFDEMYDMIVYSVFVALGFAAFENILYIFSEGSITIGIYRVLLAVPGHVCDGIFMGYYLSLAKFYSLNNKENLSTKNKYKSILIPTILHGIYDFCCFANSSLFLIIFFVFIINLYIYSIRKLKYMSNTTAKIKYKNNFCPNCGSKIDGNFCRICGLKQE